MFKHRQTFTYIDILGIGEAALCLSRVVAVYRHQFTFSVEAVRLLLTVGRFANCGCSRAVSR